MYKCKYFRIEELVDGPTYLQRGGLAWELLDEKALKTLDLLREMFGIIIVNNYIFGGKSHFRGFRPRDCEIGTQYSMHRQGKGFDLSFRHTSAQDVRNYIIAHPQSFPFITCLETDINWLHFDVRNCEPIKLVRP